MAGRLDPRLTTPEVLELVDDAFDEGYDAGRADHRLGVTGWLFLLTLNGAWSAAVAWAVLTWLT